MRRGLTVFLAGILSCVQARADIQEGLQFKSYEEDPPARTSLTLRGKNDRPVSFKEEICLEFDLNIDRAREHFGYVCRLVLDGCHTVDLLLSTPYKGLPFLGVVTDSREMTPVEGGDSAHFGEWIHVSVEMAGGPDSLGVFVGGERVSSIPSGDCPHSFVALFGANQEGRFTTNDAAPVSVRNVSLTLDRHRAGCWSLASAKDLGPRGKVSLEAANPHWLTDNHSKWWKVKSFKYGSQAYIIPNGNQGFFLVSRDDVTRYTLRSGRVRTTETPQDIHHDLLTSDFIVRPDGTLVLYDLESDPPLAIPLTPDGWARGTFRERHSPYAHHNAFYLPSDSSLVQLFGYGYHKCTSDALIWKDGTDSVKVFPLQDIAPRYLSAVAVTDSVVYIYGGKGNESGMQEYGFNIYNDFYRMDCRDGMVQRLWDRPAESQEVAAADLVLSPDGSSFYALTYSPNAFPTSLQLRKFSLRDGSSQEQGDPIPYQFSDVDSDARLLFDPETDAFYAVVGNRSGQDYEVSLYKLSCPILPGQPRRAGWRLWLWLLVSGALLAGAAGFIWQRLRRRQPSTGDGAEPLQDDAPQPPAIPETPGVHLLGGFRVFDRDCHDITASFTPLMRQLLSLIILYSDKQGGISNSELKDILWYDMSAESYNNNRNVNIRKIRVLAGQVGGLEILTANGRWLLSADADRCDYLEAMAVLENEAAPVEKILEVAERGNLLSDIRYDWTDAFKARYTDKVISRLNGALLTQKDLSAELKLRIADGILSFDSLDEDAVRLKCRMLSDLKHFGRAQGVFRNYAEEYARVMGEELTEGFNDFIREK